MRRVRPSSDQQRRTAQTLHAKVAELHQAQSVIQQMLSRDHSINGVLATGIIGFEAAWVLFQSLKRMNPAGSKSAPSTFPPPT